MIGCVRRVFKELFLLYVIVLKKDILDLNRFVVEFNVFDRMRFNMLLILVKVNDEVCIVGEVF